MSRHPLLVLLTLAACGAPSGDVSDDTVTDDSDTVSDDSDTVPGDTDVDPTDTDVDPTDTDVDPVDSDTNVEDTDPADTVVADTDPADTVVADTDPADTVVADTDPAGTLTAPSGTFSGTFAWSSVIDTVNPLNGMVVRTSLSCSSNSPITIEVDGTASPVIRTTSSTCYNSPVPITITLAGAYGPTPPSGNAWPASGIYGIASTAWTGSFIDGNGDGQVDAFQATSSVVSGVPGTAGYQQESFSMVATRVVP